MSNPFPSKFFLHCPNCELPIEINEDVYNIDGRVICYDCAKAEDRVCVCGNHKKAEYSQCWDCHEEGLNDF